MRIYTSASPRITLKTVHQFTRILAINARLILQTIRTQGAIRLASFVFVISCFFLGSYYVLFRVFTYLIGVEIIGPGLLDRIIEMSFFVFFIMLVSSNIITSFSTFYQNRELDFLFAMPVKPATIYLAKLFENCLYSSWATMVLALPMLAAYGVTNRAPWLYYPVSVFSVFTYLIMPAAIASVLIFLIFRIFPNLRSREVIFVALGLIIIMTISYIKISNPHMLKILETESEQDLLRFAANMTSLGGIYVPSTWLSNVLQEFKSTRPNPFYFLVLMSVTVSVTVIAYQIAKWLYARSWMRIGEHENRNRRRSSLLKDFRPGIARNLLSKDILLFIREPSQWVQLSVFVILLAVYVFSLRRTPLYFTLPFWRTVVSFANFAYVNFILATLGVRFIFPALSLERAGIWLLGSSPIPRRQIFFTKYIASLIMTVILVQGLLFMSNIFINTDPGLSVILPVIGLFLAASLVSICLGLGSRFPQFNEDNPSRIAAGSGGIITALISIAHVGISIIILAAPAYNYLRGKYMMRPGNPLLVALCFLLFAAVNAAAIVLPIRIGTNALEKRDY